MAGPVKTVTLRLVADTPEAQRKLDEIYAKAEELGRLNPEIKPKIDKAAVTAGLAVLRQEMKQTQKSSDDLSGTIGNLGKAGTGAGASLSGMASPMAGLAVGAVALSPIIATVGTGLVGVGIGAAGTLQPLMKASQATGGLSANMHKLNPEQQAAAKSLLSLEDSYRRFEQALAPTVLSDFGIALGVAKHLLHDLEPVSIATGKALGGMFKAVDAELQSRQWQDFFTWMGQQAGPDMALLTQNVTDLLAVLPPLLKDLQPLGVAFLQVTDGTTKLAGGIVKARDASSSFVEKIPLIGAITKTLLSMPSDLAHFLGLGAHSLDETGTAAARAAPKVKSMAHQVTDLMNAETSALNKQLGYSNALIGAAGDALSLRDALKKSGDQIGLHTAAQRNSFSTANAFIGQLEQVANQALTSGHGVDAATRALKSHLPMLLNAKSGSRLYWQEIRTLVGWYDRLRREKAITELIKITGTGYWQATGGSQAGEPGKHFVGRFAAGGKVPGQGGGDRYPILVEGGETIFPRQLTPVVAPIAKAYGLPGFAAGGKVPALETWAMRAVDFSRVSTANAVGDALARSFAAAFSARGSGAAGGGVTRWAPDILRALAMLGQSSANLGAVEHRMAQESGGNPWAINRWDVNAQMGDPSRGLMQTIMSTFERYRSFMFPDDIYNPMANIFAGLNYAIHAYPGRTLASVMMQPGGYDAGGYLPPGLSLAYNGTGRPEPVGKTAGGDVHYHVTVNVPPNANMAEIGRVTVNALKAFEARSGKSWRS